MEDKRAVDTKLSEEHRAASTNGKDLGNLIQGEGNEILDIQDFLQYSNDNIVIKINNLMKIDGIGPEVIESLYAYASGDVTREAEALEVLTLVYNQVANMISNAPNGLVIDLSTGLVDKSASYEQAVAVGLIRENGGELFTLNVDEFQEYMLNAKEITPEFNELKDFISIDDYILFKRSMDFDYNKVLEKYNNDNLKSLISERDIEEGDKAFKISRIYTNKDLNDLKILMDLSSSDLSEEEFQKRYDELSEKGKEKLEKFKTKEEFEKIDKNLADKAIDAFLQAKTMARYTRKIQDFLSEDFEFDFDSEDPHDKTDIKDAYAMILKAKLQGNEKVAEGLSKKLGIDLTGNELIDYVGEQLGKDVSTYQAMTDAVRDVFDFERSDLPELLQKIERDIETNGEKEEGQESISEMKANDSEMEVIEEFEGTYRSESYTFASLVKHPTMYLKEMKRLIKDKSIEDVENNTELGTFVQTLKKCRPRLIDALSTDPRLKKLIEKDDKLREFINKTLEKDGQEGFRIPMAEDPKKTEIESIIERVDEKMKAQPFISNTSRNLETILGQQSNTIEFKQRPLGKDEEATMDKIFELFGKVINVASPNKETVQVEETFDLNADLRKPPVVEFDFNTNPPSVKKQVEEKEEKPEKIDKKEKNDQEKEEKESTQTIKRAKEKEEEYNLPKNVTFFDKVRQTVENGKNYIQNLLGIKKEEKPIVDQEFSERNVLVEALSGKRRNDASREIKDVGREEQNSFSKYLYKVDEKQAINERNTDKKINSEEKDR